jgi:hypothetical protein
MVTRDRSYWLNNVTSKHSKSDSVKLEKYPHSAISVKMIQSFRTTSLYNSIITSHLSFFATDDARKYEEAPRVRGNQTLAVHLSPGHDWNQEFQDSKSLAATK